MARTPPLPLASERKRMRGKDAKMGVFTLYIIIYSVF